jgi:hypothetical protein
MAWCYGIVGLAAMAAARRQRKSPGERPGLVARAKSREEDFAQLFGVVLVRLA